MPSMGLESSTNNIDDDNTNIEQEQLHDDQDEDFSHQASAMPLNKSSLRTRWLILALNCAVMTASYYSYDIPSALHQVSIFLYNAEMT